MEVSGLLGASAGSGVYMDYCTVSELAEYLRIADADDDGLMAIAITAASHIIDNETRRTFGTVSTTTRTFETTDTEIRTGDLVSVSTVLDSDGTSVEHTLLPLNAGIFSKVRVPSAGIYTITGSFGRPDVPAGIKNAVLLQASRLHARRDSPFGIAGSPESGEMRLLAKVDPDVAVMLRGFRRKWWTA